MNSIRRLKTIVFMAVVVIGFITGLALARRSYFLSVKALIPSAIADIKYVTQDIDGDLTKVVLSFKTGSENEAEAMSTLAFKARTTSKVLDENGSGVNKIVPDESFSESESWELPVNRIYEEEDDTVIEFAAVNKDKEGFSMTDYVDFASFYINDDQSFEVLFDSEYSQIYSKKRPVTNIWKN